MRLFRRSRQLHGWLAVLMLAVLTLTAAGCGNEQEGSTAAAAQQGDLTLVVGAYSVAKDAMGEILPLFAEEWQAKTGQKSYSRSPMRLPEPRRGRLPADSRRMSLCWRWKAMLRSWSKRA